MSKNGFVNTKLIDIDSVMNHPMNPNQGNVEIIQESIKENGFYGGIIVQKSTGYILKGNHTVKAAKEMGMTQIPAFIIDVDDKRALKIMLMDNESTRKSTNDSALLTEVLEHLLSEGENLVGTGFTDFDLEMMKKEAEEAWTSSMTESPAEHSGNPAAFIKITCEDPDDKPILIEEIEAIIKERGIQASIQ